MKKSILILLAFFSLSMSAQIPKEAFDMTNSLHELWKKENPNEAIEVCVKLNDIYQPFLISRVHNTLAQTIKRQKGVEKASVFLDQLYNKNNISLNKIIEPIYLWNKSFKINTQEEANALLKTYYTKLSDSSNHKSKTELYGLLIINEFNNKNIGLSELKESIIAKIIKNTSNYPFIDTPSNGRKVNEERAWNRSILAYGYNMLFKKHDKEEFIEIAAKYSPDQIDTQNKSAYFYDVALLTGNPNNSDYKRKYFNYLNNSGNSKKALNILLEEALIQPTNSNLESLKNFYSELGKNENSFKTVWHEFINSKMKDVPNIKVSFESGELDLTQKHESWIYIDVWGTWCSPCVKELPEFNKKAKEFNENSNSKIKFYSFSYHSQDLKGFMSKNKYTFPVTEIDQKTNDLFEVSGYPTKILISPENKYLKIPFGVNWVEYMKNYSLID